jgi:molybdenum cofactor biosynthesis enzyme
MIQTRKPTDQEEKILAEGQALVGVNVLEVQIVAGIQTTKITSRMIKMTLLIKIKGTHLPIKTPQA